MSTPDYRSITVAASAAGMRADVYLSARFALLSRKAAAEAIRQRAVRSTSRTLKPSSQLRSGEEIRIWIPELAPGEKPPCPPLIHEDPWTLAFNKPSGMLCHPVGSKFSWGLINLAREKFPDEDLHLAHRLDKETSGVIVVAKTDPAHHVLASQFAERETGKEYIALVEGVPREKSGSVTLPIGRHPTIRVKMTVTEHGKLAHTDWEVAETFGDVASLLRCRIHTGRTHQIRVHLASLGHPILGDETYGYKPARVQVPPAPRVLLHAQKLSFTHPGNGQPFTCEAPIPQDFSDYQNLLK